MLKTQLLPESPCDSMRLSQPTSSGTADHAGHNRPGPGHLHLDAPIRLAVQLSSSALLAVRLESRVYGCLPSPFVGFTLHCKDCLCMQLHLTTRQPCGLICCTPNLSSPTSSGVTSSSSSGQAFTSCRPPDQEMLQEPDAAEVM